MLVVVLCILKFSLRMKGGNLKARLEISFMDSAKGGVQRVVVKKFSRCTVCGGKYGVLLPAEANCAMCIGEGLLHQDVLVDVTFPQGVQSHWSQVFRGLGDDHDDASFPAGDLIVTVKVIDHPFFHRVGFDVHSKLAISIVQASLGCRLRIPSIHGTITISVPAGTQSDDVVTVIDKGFPTPLLNTNGVMILFLKVRVPKGVTQEEEALLRHFDKLCKARLTLLK